MSLHGNALSSSFFLFNTVFYRLHSHFLIVPFFLANQAFSVSFPHSVSRFMPCFLSLCHCSTLCYYVLICLSVNAVLRPISFSSLISLLTVVLSLCFLLLSSSHCRDFCFSVISLLSGLSHRPAFCISVIMPLSVPLSLPCFLLFCH